MFQRIKALATDSTGATAIEYALIAALIGIAAVSAMSAIGTALSVTFDQVSADMSSSGGADTTAGDTTV
ncbi:Flp family type IVb pilin [Novosphingobium sp. KCTC 2891]|uniref:Flp family type IVb pilin n=1 Tax=Novosphingobium sp. KCTC 2891 TaxID=2989730 RepID=UPI002223DD1A|nr:Flp family type IVb pilin [Novosphingobium sp. KCTC 2891]MCW1381713.1 Flp family type IVb pilin [Novosphingobium sp. KCTC 2891]